MSNLGLALEFTISWLTSTQCEIVQTWERETYAYIKARRMKLVPPMISGPGEKITYIIVETAQSIDDCAVRFDGVAKKVGGFCVVIPKSHQFASCLRNSSIDLIVTYDIEHNQLHNVAWYPSHGRTT